MIYAYELPPQEQTLLNIYAPPDGEVAILKRVPIQALGLVRAIFRKLDLPIRVRYRGPRQNPYHTLQQDARHFSVYLV